MSIPSPQAEDVYVLVLTHRHMTLANVITKVRSAIASAFRMPTFAPSFA